MAAGADWIGADMMLDRLETVNCRAYLEMPGTERLARELARAPAEEASGATTVCRRMGREELAGYRKGELKSGEAGAADAKPFSPGLNGYAGVRPVGLAPVDDAIRGALQPAVYTAVPWTVSS